MFKFSVPHTRTRTPTHSHLQKHSLTYILTHSHLHTLTHPHSYAFTHARGWDVAQAVEHSAVKVWILLMADGSCMADAFSV